MVYATNQRGMKEEYNSEMEYTNCHEMNYNEWINVIEWLFGDATCYFRSKCYWEMSCVFDILFILKCMYIWDEMRYEIGDDLIMSIELTLKHLNHSSTSSNQINVIFSNKFKNYLNRKIFFSSLIFGHFCVYYYFYLWRLWLWLIVWNSDDINLNG